MTMTLQESYDVLATQVHAPVFFAKLANNYGYRPNSEEEAIRCLKMAGKLRNAYEKEAVKTASKQANTLDELDALLDNRLSAYGYGSNESKENTKAAAADAIQHPHIKEAAEIFAEHLSQR